MTIERTRQILGKKVAHFSDDELLAFIQQTDKALDVFFQLAVKKAYAKKKGNGIQ